MREVPHLRAASGSWTCWSILRVPQSTGARSNMLRVSRRKPLFLLLCARHFKVERSCDNCAHNTTIRDVVHTGRYWEYSSCPMRVLSRFRNPRAVASFTLSSSHSLVHSASHTGSLVRTGSFKLVLWTRTRNQSRRPTRMPLAHWHGGFLPSRLGTVRTSTHIDSSVADASSREPQSTVTGTPTP
jgi:hypothetical protein